MFGSDIKGLSQDIKGKTQGGWTVYMYVSMTLHITHPIRMLTLRNPSLWAYKFQSPFRLLLDSATPLNPGPLEPPPEQGRERIRAVTPFV